MQIYTFVFMCVLVLAGLSMSPTAHAQWYGGMQGANYSPAQGYGAYGSGTGFAGGYGGNYGGYGNYTQYIPQQAQQYLPRSTYSQQGYSQGYNTGVQSYGTPAQSYTPPFNQSYSSNNYYTSPFGYSTPIPMNGQGYTSREVAPYYPPVIYADRNPQCTQWRVAQSPYPAYNTYGPELIPTYTYSCQ